MGLFSCFTHHFDTTDYHKTLDMSICFVKRVSVGATVVFSMEIAKHD